MKTTLKAGDVAYQSIHTTCKCGKNSELKFNGSWYDNKCNCGTSIRLKRDKSALIQECSLTKIGEL